MYYKQGQDSLKKIVKLSFFNFNRIVYKTDSSTDARPNQDLKTPYAAVTYLLLVIGSFKILQLLYIY